MHRILYLHHGKLTDTGIDLVVGQQLLALSEAGYRVTLISRGRISLPGVEVVRLRAFLAKFASLLGRDWYDGLKRRAVLRAARAALKRGGYGAVITWNGLALDLVPRCAQSGLPLFINCGNLALSAKWDAAPPSRWPLVGRSERRREYGGSDAIVLATSEFACQSFIDKGVAPERVLALGRGVDTGRFTPPASYAHHGPLRVLFCGRISERKGIFQLLDAWRRAALPEARLLLVGRVPKSLSERVEQATRTLGNVDILGYRSDLPELMQSCQVQVMLSDNEGQAKSLLEGAASGLVTIATRQTGFPHGPGHSFVVEREGTERVAEILRELESDRERLAAMREAAALVIAADYSWPAFRQRFRDALARHVAHGREEV